MATCTVSRYLEETCATAFSKSLRSELQGYSAGEVFRRHARKADTEIHSRLIQYLDLKTYLVGDINTKVDRASMAHSLEVREPLMDHHLVEWLATLPGNLKIRGTEGKYLLKAQWSPIFRDEILYRPKMGFAVPMARWFRGPLSAGCEARCSARFSQTPGTSIRRICSISSMPTGRFHGLQCAVVDRPDVRIVREKCAGRSSAL